MPPKNKKKNRKGKRAAQTSAGDPVTAGLEPGQSSVEAEPRHEAPNPVPPTSSHEPSSREPLAPEEAADAEPLLQSEAPNPVPPTSSHEPSSREPLPPEEAAGAEHEEQIQPEEEVQCKVEPESPLEVKLQKMRLPSDKLAVRPGVGICGTPIKLVANYFTLSFPKHMDVFHYDVSIIFLHRRETTDQGARPQFKKGQNVMKNGRTAKEDSKHGTTHKEHQMKRAPCKQMCRKIIKELVRIKSLETYTPVYDGQKNMYTKKYLNIGKEAKENVALEEDGMLLVFEVTIKPVEKHSGSGNRISIAQLSEDLSKLSLDVIQEDLMVLDTVMCHREPPFSQVQVGRSFFLIDQRPHSIGQGLEIWQGYKQSIRPTQRGHVIIVDYTAKAFYKAGPVMDFASDVLKKDVRGIAHWDLDKIKKLTNAMVGMKIVRKIPAHMKTPLTVVEVVKKSAAEIRFNWNGTDITVAEYFARRYNNRLKYEQLPCIRVKSLTGTVHLPMELCIVPENQPCLGKGKMSRKRDAFVQKNVIVKSAIPPVERFHEINGAVRTIGEVSGETMNNFGLGLNTTPMIIPGRVMVKPRIEYKGTDTPSLADPDEQGRWEMKKGMKFCKSLPNCSWIIINFSKNVGRGDLQHFAKTLEQSAGYNGLNLDRVTDILSFGNNMTVKDVLQIVKKKYQVKLVVVVLSREDEFHSYEEVKYVGDIELRLLTQCVQDTRVTDVRNLKTIFPKLNTKLGGANHSLFQKHPFFSKPIIVFGADATHHFNQPSIAAVVGSLDARPSRYALSCRVQENTRERQISQEIIVDMKDMCKSILRRFIKETRGRLPERILFFRDGVSEGQFESVLREEIPSIRLACDEVMTGWKPPITFLVVQKRHMTRVKPLVPKEGVGRMQNTPPGTVVDTDVTHPIFYDYFINSHEGIKGTSKPAHYVVILDENGFTVDHLQRVCYHLCFTYARCNRSISMPPPVRYADLACTRARAYVNHLIDDSSTTSGQTSFPKNVVDAVNCMGTIDESMFYI